jgi:1,4-dihydroxy-2-naphthoyl-CoA synthase
MSDSVLIAAADGVATITLNRPQVLNALDAAMIVRLREACGQAAREDSVRAVLLRARRVRSRRPRCSRTAVTHNRSTSIWPRKHKHSGAAR